MPFDCISSIGFGFRGIFQIAILSALFFYIYKLFRGTRSSQMFSGIVATYFALWLVTRVFDLDVLGQILGKIPLIFTTAVIVIFQPEIRQAFLTIGHGKRIWQRDGVRHEVVDSIVSAVTRLSARKIGALIAIERNSHLLEFSKNGTMLNAPVSDILLMQIFYPNTPLHDGAVVVCGGNIVSARCTLPPSSVDLGRGQRHRAALGLSERTDAVVVVVSEETGSISIAHQGQFITNLSGDTLGKYLMKFLPGGGIVDVLKREYAAAAGDNGEGKGRQA